MVFGAGAALAALAAGCEVSFFGSEPIVVVSEHSSGGTEWAHACDEPEAARTARLAAQGTEADDEAGCLTRCRYVAGEPFECDAARATTGADGVARPSVLELDLRDHDGVVMTFEICDPDGVALQLSDSSSGAADGGDGGQSSHDADMMLNGTTLHLRAAAGTETPPSQIDGYVTEEGCSTRTVVISEQLAFLVEGERGLCGPGMFRIDPPTDTEGTPDALWYLATSGSVDGHAEGAGTRSVELCFY